MRVEVFGETFSRDDVARFAGDFGKRQCCIEHIGQIIRHGFVLQFVGAPCVVEAALLHHMGGDEAPGFFGRCNPRRFTKGGAGFGEACDHQAVPVGEDLVVEARTDAGRAGGKEFGAERCERFFFCFAERLVGAGEAVEDVYFLPIAVGRDVIDGFEEHGVFAEQRVDFGFGPDIEFAFDAFAVGVERSGEGTVDSHFAQGPVDGFTGAARVKLFAGFGIGGCEKPQELSVVVEHFFKMRGEPAFIDGIAGKAAAQMIVDAAFADVIEGFADGGADVGAACAQMHTPEEVDERCLGEFGCALDAAVNGVEQVEQFVGDDLEHGAGGFAGVIVARLIGQRLQKPCAVLFDLVGLVVEEAGDFLHQGDETRTAEFWFFRKVSAAPEGFAFGSEEHGERPAALLAEHMERVHIDRVDVRSLFAVDFHRHEQFVHDGGDFGVLETLMRHDMAPMAGGVTDRQKDRFVKCLGLGQSFCPPGSPMDRVVLVLQEIGGGFVA